MFSIFENPNKIVLCIVNSMFGSPDWTHVLIVAKKRVIRKPLKFAFGEFTVFLRFTSGYTTMLFCEEVKQKLEA